ncbi:MAG: fliH [Pseudonocardiales bacterium]|nr:fliH [Pseudonocardiales bacterium]
MPSSPDTVAWELTELRGSSLPAPPVAVFSASTLASSPPVFEVSPTAGIPEDLLASARAAAQAAGYAAGWAGGIQAARVVADAEAHAARADTERVAADRRDRLAQAFTALDTTVTELERRAMPAAEQLEDLIVTSALAIAEELVGHSLRDDPSRAPDALARALALAPSGTDLTVRVSAADYAALTADGKQIPTPQGLSRVITLLADETLDPGDAVATSGATEIDARVAAGLDRVRAVLSR